MRGRIRLISIVAIFTVILAVSAVFASGIVNPSKSLLNAIYGVQPASPGPNEVFVDPAAIVKDYVNDPGYAVGNKFLVHINVTDVTDLFTWQLNLTWNKAVLNFTKKVTYGDFLYRTASPDKTSRTVPIVGGNNASGYGWTAETILGNYAGITGSGRLVSLEFLVVGYGASNLTISTSGTLPTALLNSAGNSIAFTRINGYFRNVLKGDANMDKSVNVFDILAVKSRWGTTPASPNWIREYDVNDDTAINVFDILTVKANWGRTTP